MSSFTYAPDITLTLKEALGRLSPLEERVVLGVVYGGQTIRGLAQSLNQSVDAVRRAKTSALTNLRKRLRWDEDTGILRFASIKEIKEMVETEEKGSKGSRNNKGKGIGNTHAYKGSVKPEDVRRLPGEIPEDICIMCGKEPRKYANLGIGNTCYRILHRENKQRAMKPGQKRKSFVLPEDITLLPGGVPEGKCVMCGKEDAYYGALKIGKQCYWIVYRDKKARLEKEAEEKKTLEKPPKEAQEQKQPPTEESKPQETVTIAEGHKLEEAQKVKEAPNMLLQANFAEIEQRIMTQLVQMLKEIEEVETEQKNPYIIRLDFSQNEKLKGLLDTLKGRAESELRSISNQILWTLLYHNNKVQKSESSPASEPQRVDPHIR